MYDLLAKQTFSSILDGGHLVVFTLLYLQDKWRPKHSFLLAKRWRQGGGVGRQLHLDVHVGFVGKVSEVDIWRLHYPKWFWPR
jgi:hypothetical protein